MAQSAIIKPATTKPNQYFWENTPEPTRSWNDWFNYIHLALFVPPYSVNVMREIERSAQATGILTGEGGLEDEKQEATKTYFYLYLGENARHRIENEKEGFTIKTVNMCQLVKLAETVCKKEECLTQITWKFNSSVQLDNEDVRSFFSRLAGQIKKCGYSTPEVANRHLKDIFILNMRHEVIKQKLLEEDRTLDEVKQIAFSMDRGKKAFLEIQNGPEIKSEPV